MWKTLVFLIVLIALLLLLAKGLRGVPKPSKAIVSARVAWRVEKRRGPAGFVSWPFGGRPALSTNPGLAQPVGRFSDFLRPRNNLPGISAFG
jgi:hypothetical protein